MAKIIKNDRLIKALLREPVDRTPIWIMRQAGRYLPEYRKLREKAGNFLVMCKTPELASAVTLQPLQRFPLDAAIIFSDILTIPDAMNLGLYFVEGEGPKFSNPIQTQQDIDNLIIPDPNDDLGYVMQAIKIVSAELDSNVPLIGFSGSPWTLACYMIEGGSSKDYQKTKTLMYQNPKAMHQLLSKLSVAVVHYLNAQIDAGADAVMIFDTWGGILAEPQYLEFSLQYMQQIIQGITKQRDGQTIPTIVFTKGSGLWLEHIAAIGCHAVGLDWTIDIGKARERIGAKVALQGNLDPTVLYATPDKIVAEAQRILQRFGNHPGHVFNLGHGITPGVSPEHVALLVETVHNYRS